MHLRLDEPVIDWIGGFQVGNSVTPLATRAQKTSMGFGRTTILYLVSRKYLLVVKNLRC